MKNMKLILEEWNKFVETVENIPEADTLEEAITFMENYLQENAELLDEDWKKKLTGGLAGLMMMMGTVGGAQAADISKPQLGMDNATYVQVIDLARDLGADGRVDGKYSSSAQKEYREIVGLGMKLQKDKDYANHYLAPAKKYIEKLGGGDDSAAHVFALGMLNKQAQSDSVEPEPEPDPNPDVDKNTQGNRSMKLINTASAIKSAELAKDSKAAKKAAIDAFNIEVDSAVKAGFASPEEGEQLKQLGNKADITGVQKLVQKIASSKK